MKLATPKPGHTIVMDFGKSRAVVRGIFPPERATAEREKSQHFVDAMQPMIEDALRKAQAETHRIIMGQIAHGGMPSASPGDYIFHTSDIVEHINSIPVSDKLGRE